MSDTGCERCGKYQRAFAETERENERLREQNAEAWQNNARLASERIAADEENERLRDELRSVQVEARKMNQKLLNVQDVRDDLKDGFSSIIANRLTDAMED